MILPRLYNSLKKLRGSAQPGKRRSRRGRVAACRPWLEVLEGRIVPMTNTWTGGNADWSIIADWSQGHTPVAGEDVQIANGAMVTHSVNSTAGGDDMNSLIING